MPPHSHWRREDPYREWAATWAWMLYDRTLCAHMGGEDSLALAGCRALDKLRSNIETTVALRKQRFPTTEHMPGDFPMNESEPLDFLEPVPELLRDRERRLSAQGRPSARQVIAGTHPPQISLDRPDAREGGSSRADAYRAERDRTAERELDGFAAGGGRPVPGLPGAIPGLDSDGTMLPAARG